MIDDRLRLLQICDEADAALQAAKEVRAVALQVWVDAHRVQEGPERLAWDAADKAWLDAYVAYNRARGVLHEYAMKHIPGFHMSPQNVQ